MTIKTAKADFVSDEVVEEVAQMLRSLKTPDEFVILASRWLSSCLYKNYRQDGSPAPPYQTLKEILTDVLDEMDAENHEYAKILRSRFWKGSTVKEIILDSPWSARTFFSLQNKAIRLYAFLLVQKEEACRQSNRKNRLINAGRSFLTRANPPRENLLKRNGLILTMGLVILALTVALIWSISGTSQDHRISQPDPTASEAVDVAQPEVSSGLGSDVPVQSLLVNGSLETSRSSLCGGDLQVSASQAERFIRSQGVSAFTVDNTAGGILSDRIRTLVNGPGGLWIGYFDEGSHRGGLGHYDKKSWVECSTTEFDLRQNINTLISDEHGNLWIGFEEGGVAHFDGRNWRRYTTLDGLPSDKVYGLTIDSAGLLWVGTWEGIARFDGETWTVPYNARNGTIFNDHVHAVAFDSNNNIWVGHIRAGVSHYQQEGGKWVSYTTKSGHLGGDQIRSILVRPAGVDYPESIWFASSDGGISKYEQGEWRIYQIQNGLPGNDVRGLALDRYNRVWAATGKGVVYLEDEVWKTYNTIDTISLSIEKTCRAEECVFDDDNVWTGTVSGGLTHSRLPLPEPVFDIMSVCFVSSDRERICPDLVPNESLGRATLTAAYPFVLAPGETLRFEVTVMSRPPYQLRSDRGDFLSNLDSDDFNLFGAWPIVPAREVVEPGQPYTFTDFDNPFVTPLPTSEVGEEIFTSSWRIWMQTRYAGPEIRMQFTVSN